MGKATGRTKAAKRPARPATAAEARERTAAIVESPYGNGVDRVSVVDPIVCMVRQGRLDVRQQSAAHRYRKAFDRVYGAQACILGKDGTTSRGIAGGASQGLLEAAGELREADRILGWTASTVRAVVGYGRSLDELAAELEGEASRTAKASISAVLRQSLTALAEVWFPETARMGVTSTEMRAASMGEAGVREVGKAVHCTARRVYG
ncbi:hypothetical protein L1787_07670 [Acuticoccus sp. M5D2P5]|uniref:hypothetical protein n=1 Tax=Acuticoccus kalidii TaxID=2910977 RepID=UPI001F45B0A3|nr:hypothetical protein [Acuticoccus kalidii]MCF3933288.1 hypothetical protein [Acuticoccus kalidii]